MPKTRCRRAGCCPASRIGRSARWGWAPPRRAGCSCWSQVRPRPAMRNRQRTMLRACVSGSVTPRSSLSRSRRRQCSRLAGRCARAAACRWTPPATPARFPMARGRSSERAGSRPEKRTEQLLAGLPDLKVLGLLHGSAHHTFLAELQPPPPGGLPAVVQPARAAEPPSAFAGGGRRPNAGDPLRPDLCGDVERALADMKKGGLEARLEKLISPAEVRMLKRRLRGVLDPEWRFPEPTSAWSVPWPPI